MPKIQSAKKALRQNVRRRKQNLDRKKEMTAAIKKFNRLLLAGKKDEAQKCLSEVYKTLDKMAKVNFIKRGRADRLKSRLTKKLKPGAK